ncbi:FG-GAP repeat protein [Algoriphagus sp.]|uniref:FG-GAP repeat protein n=1 Tax=Algoriphagus sp. TaxID=1872435 RepID=UPI003F6E88AF
MGYGLVIGDVDGDGRLDLIASVRYKAYIIQFTGHALTSPPFYSLFNSYSMPKI